MTLSMKCQALDSNGKQCKRNAIGCIQFHGDSEICSDNLTWVLVAICKKHVEDTAWDDDILPLTKLRSVT